MSEKKLMYHVLVAEDEAFQRLSLIDVLYLCDYDGIQKL